MSWLISKLFITDSRSKFKINEELLKLLECCEYKYVYSLNIYVAKTTFSGIGTDSKIHANLDQVLIHMASFISSAASEVTCHGS